MMKCKVLLTYRWEADGSSWEAVVYLTVQAEDLGAASKMAFVQVASRFDGELRGINVEVVT